MKGIIFTETHVKSPLLQLIERFKSERSRRAETYPRDVSNALCDEEDGVGQVQSEVGPHDDQDRLEFRPSL